MPRNSLVSASPGALPVHFARPDTVDDVLSDLPAEAAAWVRAHGFSGKSGQTITYSSSNGGLAGAIVGLGADNGRARFVAGHAIAGLPEGDWAVQGPADDEVALGYLLASYRFDRYAKSPLPKARLIAPEGTDRARIEAIATGECLTRDLINTPAADMGPSALEAAARQLASDHGAQINVKQGAQLVENNFPLIHAVGRAASDAPRLIDMVWGASGPSLTLVGKGVCFDTGGLNLKPGGSMGLMKKDMGGAATVLGLAHMIMATGAELRLRVLIPAVENSVSAPSFRPGDILTARNGKTVEVNNTDAEGRLVLADALTYAVEGGAPELLVSMATLTGAARVAVGPDLAPFYATEPSDATVLKAAAAVAKDPVWELPFHDPYEPMIEPGIADLDNAPSGGFGGSITAALFLRRFTSEARYLHFDIYGWTPNAAPGRPKGGAGQGARALFEAIPELVG